tara:strand:+ start:315 stop:605 length:291 start_codon:yes stop_codon:yes gene_type:complete
MNIKLLKLVTGDEVLARVDVDRSGMYTLKMPVTITQDDVNLGFEPFMPYAASDTFEIDAAQVVFSCDPTPALGEHYIQTTSAIDMSASQPQGIITQ